MKIAMLVSNPYETDHRVQKEARTLRSKGFSLKILSWNYKENRFHEDKKGIKIERFISKSPRGTSSLLRSYMGLLEFQIWAFVKLLKTDFDIVHCHNFDTVPSGYLAGRLKGKKVVFDIHDFYFTYLTLEGDSRVLRSISKVLQRVEIWFAKRVDSLIVTTPKYYEYYSKIAPQKPVIILYNSPEKAFSGSKSSASSEGNFVVSYIGSVRYERQITELIKSTAKVPETEVLIVGGGVGSDKIKELCEDNKHVTFIDEVPYPEVPRYYEISNCIFALYDTRDENTKYLLPVKVMEAMAFGIPAIVAKNSFAGDFVEENMVGLAVEDGPRELEKAILLLKSDEELYGEFKRNGLRLFEEKFNWEKTSKDLLWMYKALGREEK